MTLTARSLYAYNPRQGARSVARYHAVLDQPMIMPLQRQAGDALCKPRDKFWGLAEGNPTPVNCPRCLELAGRYGVMLRTEGACPFCRDSGCLECDPETALK